MRHKLLVKAPAAGENRTHPKAGPVGTTGGLAAGLLAGAPPTFFAIAVFAIAFFAIASSATASPAAGSTAATSPAAPYPAMAPIEAYLMDRSQEIALARTAAPGSISKDATILVMTRKGYETAIAGSNGFVCWVGRGFVGASDAPERWNPKIRAADCENPQAARTIVPLAKLRTAMILAGHTNADILGRIRTALSTREIPPLESGAMSYMMSKSSYLTDQGGHDMPHPHVFRGGR